MGMTRADVAEQEMVDVLGENFESVALFVDLSTQWRCHMKGAYGLDYGVLPAVMRIRGIKRARWSEFFDDVRIMESEALKTLREAQSDAG